MKKVIAIVEDERDIRECLTLIARVAEAVHASRTIQHVVVVAEKAGEAVPETTDFGTLLAGGSATLEAEPTSRDAPAFWLYSSGSTGRPKGCVHLQHDMAYSELAFARNVRRSTQAAKPIPSHSAPLGPSIACSPSGMAPTSVGDQP